MQGQDILVRSLTVARTRDKYENLWQYHSRSDRHAKIASWTLAFDLLTRCSLLREHARADKMAFDVNHPMERFAGRRKNMDIVFCVPRIGRTKGSPLTFGTLAAEFDIELSEGDRETLGQLPELYNREAANVLVALESKACMTAHVKAGPRLHDELASSAEYMNSAARNAVAVGYAIVNAAPTFISSDRNKVSLHDDVRPEVSNHNQPRDTEHTLSVIGRLPVRAHVSDQGFDAIGVTTIVMRNDGSPVALASSPPAVAPQHLFHYDTMIDRIAAAYESRFATL